MKRLLIAGLVLALLVPACALAQSAFNGTWETPLASIHGSDKPVTVSIKNGIYHCTCSNPPISVKADGQDHAVKGHSDFDSTAITLVNDHTVHEVNKKDGKVTSDGTVTVAADGKTAIYEFTDNSGTSPVTGKLLLTRAGSATPGANAVVGSWRFGHWEDLSDNARTFTYKVDGDDVSYSDPTGDAYTAKIGGKAGPYTGGGMSGMTVSVRKHGKDGLRETFMHDGKVTRTNTMTVSADGKTMNTSSHNMHTGGTSTLTSTKQ